MTGAHDPARAADTERPERWLVLVAAIVAQATFSAAYFGLPSIGSEIAAADDLTLGEVGLVLSAPLFGMLLSVAAVGVAADRYGERIVIGGGLALAALALLGASTADGPLGLAAWLALAGVFGATAAIGGRAAAAWFSDADRAFAVSARQSAPMLGAAAGALVLPVDRGGAVGAARLRRARARLRRGRADRRRVPPPPPGSPANRRGRAARRAIRAAEPCGRSRSRARRRSCS